MYDSYLIKSGLVFAVLGALVISAYTWQTYSPAVAVASGLCIIVLSVYECYKKLSDIRLALRYENQ